MPWPLRIATLASLYLGATHLLGPVVRGFTFDPLGDRLSGAELSRSGAVAAVALLNGLALLAVTFGLLRRRRWVRPLLVAFPVIQMLPFVVIYWVIRAPGDVYFDLMSIYWSVVWALLAAVYSSAPRRRGTISPQGLRRTSALAWDQSRTASPNCAFERPGARQAR